MSVETPPRIQVVVGPSHVACACGEVHTLSPHTFDISSWCTKELAAAQTRVKELEQQLAATKFEADRIFVPSGGPLQIVGDYMTQAELVEAFVAQRRKVDDLANDRAAADAEAAKLRQELEGVRGDTLRAEAEYERVSEQLGALRREMGRHVQQQIETRCPTCGHASLFIGAGGHLTCSWTKCTEPGVARAVDDLRERAKNAENDRVKFLERRIAEGRKLALDTLAQDEGEVDHSFSNQVDWLEWLAEAR